MFEMFKKPDETNQNEAAPSESENTYDYLLSTLEALGVEEKSLLEEKSQLTNMEETMRQQIHQEIDAKKRHIEKLKNEIPKLKQKCEVLAKALGIPVLK